MHITKDIVDTAMLQRSTFSLESLNGILKGTVISGIPLAIKNGHLQVDVIKSFGSSQWQGMNVQVFFRLMDDQKNSTSYQFTSRILRLEPSNDSLLLTLPLPKLLASGQRRNFLRVNPSQDTLLALGFWLLPGDAPLPTSYKSLNEAHLSYRPERNHSSISLENISAGGLRLRLSEEDLKTQEEVDLGTQVLCLLMLKTDEHMPPLALWLMGTITNIKKQPSQQQEAQVGIHCTHWAQAMNNDVAISWFNTSKDRGVPPLFSWVIRHDLEQQAIVS